MMNQYDLDKQYRDEMLRQAEQSRMLQQSRSDKPGSQLFRSVMNEVGRQMVSLGQKLQEQNSVQPAAQWQPETSTL
ncbi:MAG: hypothetical protein SF029_19830 [bacterium]|nr:hypothetical protein [bacterium]